ncbi:sodium-dependent transporter [Paramicrobacterium fandaimingii]|uniref:sodium-dependent transporter n=1 Tax=Paramicrobacterium fandaimingii TaxID=2708079 RepID=UPI00189F0340|nr:sodium-dependent transporter [Microbacterium fandaimingii]
MKAQSSGLGLRTRETFSGRNAFIFAAIGSAVGLGNIWRFPYVAYDNGGGAFIVPYLIALVTAGIPLLFLDYAIGHKFRGSPPMAFRRLHKKAEMFGWWQVAICFVIAVYYAVIIAWAACYTWFSVTKAWGDDPAGFLMGEFLHVSDEVNVQFSFVPGVLIPLVLVWVAAIAILAFGVQKGIARSAMIFIPLLFVMFIILVVQSLFLPGALTGLEALFTPDWSRMADSGVWIAAYGQIFFSLSVAFGIMLTYSSYLKKKTDLTGSGFVVGFTNSGFEILAGIGVFAALGFIAVQNGQAVDEVATSGIGLAFIGFPAIISQAPAGALLGVLFFASLVFAGFTSMVSILEVVISSVKDKLGLSRVGATLGVGIPMAIISILLFPTTTGLNLLDVTDAFVNSFGIVAVALVVVIFLTAGFTALPKLRDHLNKTSSVKMGRTWMMFVGGITPIILGYILIDSLQTRIAEGYGDMPTWFVGVFGWGMAIALIVVAYLLSKLPWSSKSALHDPDIDGEPVDPPILDPEIDAAEMARHDTETGEFAAANAHEETEPTMKRSPRRRKDKS